MKVTKTNNVYKASRITGPKHNYLGLVFTKVQPTETKLVRHTLNNEPVAIDPAQVIAAVVAGIEEANRANPTTLYADSVEYVISDTPDYAAYFQLAKAIAESASADFQ